MISLLFALAVTVQPGELYYDELGCKWRAAPAPVAVMPAKAAPRPASAPSAPAVRRKPRPSYAKPVAPQDEFIGCESTPVRPFAVIPPDDEPPLVTYVDIDKFETIPGMPPPTKVAPPSEETFVSGSGPDFPPYYYQPPIFIGGPVYLPPVLPAIPEPSTALLFGAGLLGLLWVSTKTRSKNWFKRR